MIVCEEEEKRRKEEGEEGKKKIKIQQLTTVEHRTYNEQLITHKKHNLK